MIGPGNKITREPPHAEPVSAHSQELHHQVLDPHLHVKSEPVICEVEKYAYDADTFTSKLSYSN